MSALIAVFGGVIKRGGKSIVSVDGAGFCCVPEGRRYKILPQGVT